MILGPYERKTRRIPIKDLVPFGSGLNRPECVLTTARGEVHVSDSRGGILTFGADGWQRLTAAPGLLPNGFALMPDGSFLVANMGRDGGVWQLFPDGQGSHRPFLLEADGEPLGSANFVLLDEMDRIWISVSSRRAHEGNYSASAIDGRLIVVERGWARTVADGLCWSNECRLDASRGVLYVNETFARRITRFEVDPAGNLSRRDTVTEFGAGTYPDGLAIDAEGALWITSVISNRVIRVLPSGEQELFLEDPAADIEAFEELFADDRLTRNDLHRTAGARLRNVSSLAFGGADLRTAFLGSLGADRLETFRAPVAGQPPVHWRW